jgi:hypothetical protein
MSDFQSDDHEVESCPGCRPVVFDPQTGKIVEHLSAIAGRVFDSATPEQRKAWHRVTCLNSRDLIDVNLARLLVERIHNSSLD